MQSPLRLLQALSGDSASQRILVVWLKVENVNFSQSEKCTALFTQILHESRETGYISPHKNWRGSLNLLRKIGDSPPKNLIVT